MAEVAASQLRVALLGDSWVAGWNRHCETEDWKREAPIADVLEAAFPALIGERLSVELIVAGFPGCTSARILELAQFCRLREMADLSATGASIKRDLLETLQDMSIPTMEQLTDCGASACENVDVVVLLLGCNDLRWESGWIGSSDRVVTRLRWLRQLYRGRGVEVILVSLGMAGLEDVVNDQELEAECARANERLLAEEGAVDCEEFLAGFDGSELWLEDGWHLTAEGYSIFGQRLAEHVASRFEPNRLYDVEQRDALCSSPAVLRCAANPGRLAGCSVSAQVAPTAVFTAARKGQLKMVRDLLELSPEAVSQPGSDAQRHTLLHIAAGSGYVDMVKMLLGAGADVNALATGNGFTPLSEACYWALKSAAAGDGSKAGFCFCVASVLSRHGGWRSDSDSKLFKKVLAAAKPDVAQKLSNVLAFDESLQTSVTGKDCYAVEHNPPVAQRPASLPPPRVFW